MKKIFITLLLLFFAGYFYANPVELKRAANIAKNVYYEKINLHQKIDYNTININYLFTETSDNYNIYYVFNAQAGNTKGFIVISADDVAKPILAYSFEGFYETKNPSPEQSYFMKRYNTQILEAIKSEIKPSEEILSIWQKYEFAQKSTNEIQIVEPLVKTKFGQSFPYNEMCPSNSQGTALVGCVAVSYGQILKYWGYPAQGTGSHSYYASGFGTQYANFGNTNYHFENIPLQGSGSNEYLARLLYHCGVAVEMHYGIDGSGSYAWNIPSTIDDYFGFSDDADYISKSNYSDATWLNIIKNQLDNGWPTEYDGSSDDGGHSWICDGYDGDMLHMNWGWNGSGNGYYDINDLTPQGSSTFDTDGACINLYPANNNSSCNSLVVTGSQGNFNDGSIPGNYQSGQNCQYLIQPTCNSYVTLNFNSCELASGDHLYIYDGDNTNADLLYDITSSTNTAIIGDIVGNSPDGMLLVFDANTGGAAGWDVSYDTRKCKYISYQYELENTFDDGSKSCNYDNSTSCKWYIEPNGTFSNITINFNEFELADAADYVSIWSGHSTSSSDLIATLHAGDTPGTYIVNNTKATIRFSSSSTGNVAAGWEIHYTTGTTDINKLNSYNNVNVYPNPFNNDATIEFTSQNNTKLKITILNLIGEKLGEINTTATAGKNNYKLSDIATNNIEKGIYFVKLNHNNTEEIIKIISLK